ncbi:hypothetical protein BDZ94DRAFT_1241880 [Collybia nuda]|uniref:Uncharacterized protein n=1 Tax=Collybia nuda TaxID=64659 RepID=A0A9P5XUJ0_9AGAR|nr:hypothetical protein BDZ94DRAFT_1241880 [Collybia nuda]
MLNSSLIHVNPPTTTPSIRTGHLHYTFFPLNEADASHTSLATEIPGTPQSPLNPDSEGSLLYPPTPRPSLEDSPPVSHHSSFVQTVSEAAKAEAPATIFSVLVQSSPHAPSIIHQTQHMKASLNSNFQLHSLPKNEITLGEPQGKILHPSQYKPTRPMDTHLGMHNTNSNKIPGLTHSGTHSDITIDSSNGSVSHISLSNHLEQPQLSSDENKHSTVQIQLKTSRKRNAEDDLDAGEDSERFQAIQRLTGGGNNVHSSFQQPLSILNHADTANKDTSPGKLSSSVLSPSLGGSSDSAISDSSSDQPQAHSLTSPPPGLYRISAPQIQSGIIGRVLTPYYQRGYPSKPLPKSSRILTRQESWSTSSLPSLVDEIPENKNLSPQTTPGLYQRPKLQPLALEPSFLFERHHQAQELLAYHSPTLSPIHNLPLENLISGSATGDSELDNTLFQVIADAWNTAVEAVLQVHSPRPEPTTETLPNNWITSPGSDFSMGSPLTPLEEDKTPPHSPAQDTLSSIHTPIPVISASSATPYTSQPSLAYEICSNQKDPWGHTDASTRFICYHDSTIGPQTLKHPVQRFPLPLGHPSWCAKTGKPVIKQYTTIEFKGEFDNHPLQVWENDLLSWDNYYQTTRVEEDEEEIENTFEIAYNLIQTETLSPEDWEGTPVTVNRQRSRSKVWQALQTHPMLVDPFAHLPPLPKNKPWDYGTTLDDPSLWKDQPLGSSPLSYYVKFYSNPYEHEDDTVAFNVWNPRITSLRKIRAFISYGIQLTALYLLKNNIRNWFENNKNAVRPDTIHYFFHHCHIFRYLDPSKPGNAQGFSCFCLHYNYETTTYPYPVRTAQRPHNYLLTPEEDEFLYHASVILEHFEKVDMVNVIRDMRATNVFMAEDAFILFDAGYLEDIFHFDANGMKYPILWDQSTPPTVFFIQAEEEDSDTDHLVDEAFIFVTSLEYSAMYPTEDGIDWENDILIFPTESTSTSLPVSDPELKVFTAYKRVAHKVHPVSGTFPEEARVRRTFPYNPLDSLQKLSPNPPEFVPTKWLTQERIDGLNINDKNFLWPEEEKLFKHVLKLNEATLPFEEKDRGTLSHDYFSDYIMPTIPHTPWEYKHIPIPPGIRDKPLNKDANVILYLIYFGDLMPELYTQHQEI